MWKIKIVRALPRLIFVGIVAFSIMLPLYNGCGTPGFGCRE